MAGARIPPGEGREQGALARSRVKRLEEKKIVLGCGGCGSYADSIEEGGVEMRRNCGGRADDTVRREARYSGKIL
jgi:hypothetical protein